MNTNDRWIRLNVAWSDSDWLFDLPPGSRLAWIELLCYTKRDGIAGKVKAMSEKVASRKWRVSEGDVETLLTEAAKDLALSVSEGYWTVNNWKEYQGADITRVEKWREEQRKKEPKKEENQKDIDNDRDIDIDSKGVTLPPVTECYVTDRNKPLHNVTTVTPKKEKTITPSQPSLDLLSEAEIEQDEFIREFNAYCHKVGSKEPDILEKDRGSMRQMLTNGMTLDDLRMMFKWIKGEGQYDWVPNFVGTFRELVKIAGTSKVPYYKTIYKFAVTAKQKPGKKGSVSPTQDDKEEYKQQLRDKGIL